MALTLAQVIAAARHRSPWFHPQRGTPDKVIGDALSDYQNELIAQACLRDKHFLSQTATILLQLGTGDPATLAGAGADDGLPGAVTDNVISSVPAAAGTLVEVGLIFEDGAVIHIANTAVTSATSTTLTKTGASRTDSADVGLVLYIARGTGAGQARYVLSNTAEEWTVAEWETTPDDTSVFTLVAPAYAADGNADVALSIPATQRRAGYLVRLDAGGIPYIDLAAPLVATLDSGITLPSASGITGVRSRTATGCTEPIDVVSRTLRDDADYWPAVYIINTTLYFCGRADDWNGIAQLEVEYVPVAPAFESTADYFLLPDGARPALVAKAAETLAHRTAEIPGTQVDLGAYQATVAQAEAQFLATLILSRRARRVTLRGDSDYA